MDPFEELERMAINAKENDQDTPSDPTIENWQTLFGYSYDEAKSKIESQRSDYGRIRVSNDHWNLIRSRKEAQGYGLEAFEHELELQATKKPTSSSTTTAAPLSRSESRATHLIKLEGRLNTASKIQEAAGLSEKPPIVPDEDHTTFFCQINGQSKRNITLWLKERGISTIPTFARVPQSASKDFESYSIHPTLGVDATLPQHRINSSDTIIHPTQDEYPVFYFFYGTLATPDKLTQLLSLSTDNKPVLHPAKIRRGRLGTWGGKYKALVDGPESACVVGSAFLVVSKEHEDALRGYETDAYEIVRCSIFMEDSEVRGCTFRFVGDLD